MRQLLKQFLTLESSSGIFLFVAAILAMILANSPLEPLYQHAVDSSLFIVNDGLMAVFFLVVGLELKRGFIEGRLSEFSQIALPLFAAVGGMLMPALIYYFINADNANTLVAWATPVATDIAFALGVLSLFGQRIPPGLKLFLLALAIFDDLGAIIIITFFYAAKLSYLYLIFSAALVLLLYMLNVYKVRKLMPYLLVGPFLWFCLLKAGIHPTIGGVLLALFIPATAYYGSSAALRLEKALHPWVAFGVMPLFALVNAGFSWQELSLNTLTSVLVLGIALGLFVGKQVGVFGFAWLLVRAGLAKLPKKTTWLEVYGVALLCGIGFTMSLFLGTLSFHNNSAYLSEVRVGVIIGSVLSGLVGAFVLHIAYARKNI